MDQRFQDRELRFHPNSLMMLITSFTLGACLGKLPSNNCVEGVCIEDGAVSSSNLPHGIIDLPSEFITLTLGAKLNLQGRVQCPAQSSPCRFQWDMNEKQISISQNPGPVSFNSLGFYTLRFTVTDSRGTRDPNPSSAHIAVWDGHFEDKFNRAEIEWDTYGWRRPFLTADKPYYELQSSWLHVTGDYNRPGSTAITPWPIAQDARVEVTVKRANITTDYHWTDTILRMHPLAGAGRFYRVRLAQTLTPPTNSNPAHYGLEIAIFKILQSTDEHGVLLNDPSQPVNNLATQANPKYPTVCQACPTIPDYPRDKNIRMITEIKGSQFHIQLFQPDRLDKPVLETTAIDTLGTPYLYEGFVGLTHFEGVSDFDDFVYRKLN